MLKYRDFVEVFLRAVYTSGYTQTTYIYSIFVTVSAEMKKFSPRHEDLSYRKTHGEIICNLITRADDEDCCIASTSGFTYHLIASAHSLRRFSCKDDMEN